MSIGIPAFNRPTGLARTLNCLINQTYRNLEIIISDDASPNLDVETTAREFATNDSRITFYRQSKSIGMNANFQFVLSKATGEYFMWAADDDEWHPEFIARCLENIGTAGGCMSGLEYHFRAVGLVKASDLPVLTPLLPTYINLRNYLLEMQLRLFYGIYVRRHLLWFLQEEAFDWMDSYTVFRQIAKQGFTTFPSVLYRVGIDAQEYIIKPHHPQKNRLLEYWPFLTRCIGVVMQCKSLRPIDKLRLVGLLCERVATLFVKHESHLKPAQVKFVRGLLGAYRTLMRAYHKAFIRKKSAVNKNMHSPCKF